MPGKTANPLATSSAQTPRTKVPAVHRPAATPTIIIPKLHTARFVTPTLPAPACRGSAAEGKESAVASKLPTYQLTQLPNSQGRKSFVIPTKEESAVAFQLPNYPIAKLPNSPKLPVVQPKFAPVPSIGNRSQGTGNRSCRFAPVPQFGQVQPVLQAKTAAGQPRFYPNLNPAAAAIKADPTEFMRLERGYDESYYRMRRGGDHGLLVPNSKFIFVRTMDGDMVMHQRYRHPVLAQGKPVLYAGEASFNNGKLDWWSNGSGNYRPDSDHAEQAALPMERFFTYEQVLKGANKQAQQQKKPAE